MEPGGRAGRIPSAVHQPLDDLYDDRGAFRPGTELRSVFAAADAAAAVTTTTTTTAAADPGRPGELITYCTIGGSASTAWFVSATCSAAKTSVSTTDHGPSVAG